MGRLRHFTVWWLRLATVSIVWRANRWLVPVRLPDHENAESKCDQQEEHTADDDANNSTRGQFFRLLNVAIILIGTLILLTIVGIVSLRLEGRCGLLAHGPFHVFSGNELETFTTLDMNGWNDAADTVWIVAVVVFLCQIVVILSYCAIVITYNWHLQWRIRLSLLTMRAIPYKVIVLCNCSGIWLFDTAVKAWTVRKVLCAVHSALPIDSCPLQVRKDA